MTSTAKGVAFLVLATFTISLQNVAIKWMGGSYSALDIVEVAGANQKHAVEHVARVYFDLATQLGLPGLREQIDERQEVPPQGRKWKVAVCGPQRPAQVALGPDFTIGWDSNAADFAMTLGQFYCKGLTAPVLVEIKRDDVVFARVYDIRGRSISSLLAIPAP